MSDTSAQRTHSELRHVAFGPTSELETFQTSGVVKRPGVIGDEAVANLRNDFWHAVEEKFGIGQNDPESWFVNPHNPAGDDRLRRLSGMNSIMDELRGTNSMHAAEQAVVNMVDDLFGAGRWAPRSRWYSLLSFPGSNTTWDVPSNSWHNDLPIVVGDPEPWTFFAFVFLDRVEHSTGPTLTITGSHRRGNVIAEDVGNVSEREVGAFADVNADLVADPTAVRLLPVGELLPALTNSDPWFHQLVHGAPSERRAVSLLETGTSSGGIDNHVVALTGSAGDVTLMDPRCLHTASANISARPRQVLRLDFRRMA